MIAIITESMIPIDDVVFVNKKGRRVESKGNSLYRFQVYDVIKVKKDEVLLEDSLYRSWEVRVWVPKSKVEIRK